MAHSHIIIQSKAGIGGECYAVTTFCYLKEWHIILKAAEGFLICSGLNNENTYLGPGCGLLYPFNTVSYPH